MGLSTSWLYMCPIMVVNLDPVSPHVLMTCHILDHGNLLATPWLSVPPMVAICISLFGICHNDPSLSTST